MPTTRAQAAAQHEGGMEVSAGTKRPSSQKAGKNSGADGKPPAKRARMQKSKRTGPKKDNGQDLESPDKKSTDVGSPSEDFHKIHGTLERGHIYFFYRPKVALEESHDIDDVSKFYLLLVPRPDVEGKVSAEASAAPAPEPQNKPKKRFRHIAVGKKRLPDPAAKHEVFWASVLNASDNLDALEKGLEEQVYQTKTRGERHVQPARLAGRGSYVIYSPTNESLPRSKRDQTYIAYHLSHPSPPGEVQSELGIHPSSSFVLQVKNPDAPSAPQAGLHPDKRADYPPEGKREAFGQGVGSKKFVPANPTTLLDFTGAELLLIADKKDIDDVIGKERARDLERTADTDAEKLSTEEVMRELLLDAEKFPADAIEGNWI